MAGSELVDAWARVAWVGLAASAVVGCPQLIGADWGEYVAEDVCLFLEDPNNCYSSFQLDVAARCGALGIGDGPTGSFASRDTLDVCFLDRGGQVVFDPPLDIAAFPPESASFRILDDQAQECGQFKYSGDFNYSVIINSCGEPDLPNCESELDESNETASVQGGKLIVASSEDNDELTLTCTDGQVHQFDLRHIDIMCRGYDQLIPRAEIESSPGNMPPPRTDPADPEVQKFAGFIRFRVSYAEPIESDVSSTNTVEYFNCLIPAPTPICYNGKRDNFETDVDCGGSLCDRRCGDGQDCGSSSDCMSGDCQLNNGSLKCTTYEAEGAGGGGGVGGQ
ncbi:hypothetical protein [Sorangium sp. So ce1099]|uniref:hypothetical protein n=1 Tax=Sorangium sp. So ce1099 TaxID=3133331 RepID=UPI003F62C104